MVKTHFLDMIRSSKDLKLLNKYQLRLLAQEIRERIIEVVSKTGGHLASNLGVVELAIALHYVFNPPKDKIVWDVGHQSYAHKLLTGRNDRFHTLRQYGGLSGYPNPEESEYDVVITGHASTSISIALGIAKARDLKNERYKVIAIIGDGALTGGLALEGLNQAGHLKTDLIVILNDNKMSISKNVGAFSEYLRRIVTYPKYVEMRKKIKQFLQRFPYGKITIEKVFELEDWVRAFIKPGMIFKELGFKYYGPINGHNLDELIKALNNIKQLSGPILLHVVTEKGKGYKFAENDKVKFHGVKPFNVEDGRVLKENRVTYTEIFGKSLIELAEKDKDIVAITAAMASGTGLEKFGERFPTRFFDVGIAEQHAVTFAAGLAVNKLKPVCAIYSTFLQRAYDQILHDVCLQNLHVVFAVDRAGLVGRDGPTHHGCFDISYLRHMPNMVLMAPRNENELRCMLYTALQYDGPIAFRYPRDYGEGVKLTNFKKLKIGESQILRKGKELVVIGVGPLINRALEAVQELEYDVAVIDARFVKPIDKKIIKIVKGIGKVLTIEENSIIGGFGSAILELVNDLDIEIKMLGIPDRFIEHGPLQVLRKKICLDHNGIKNAIKSMLDEKNKTD